MDMFKISKENTVTSVKNAVREKLLSTIINALKKEYGEESVKFVRTGEVTKVNEIGVAIAVVEEDGKAYEWCATINPTIKNYKDKTTKKGKTKAFDLNARHEEFVSYCKERDEKESEAKRLKEEKIKRDTKAREKRKREEAE